MKLNKDRLSEIIRGFSGVELLVIGDLILDSYLECLPLGVANEAPVPLVEIQNEQRTPGGAGNVATNLALLGVQARLVAPVGTDPEATQLERMLADAGVAFVPFKVRRPTPHKTRILSGKHYYLRLDEEQADPLNEDEASAFEQVVQKNWGKPAALLVSDYDKGAVTPSLVRWMEAEAHRMEVPIYADLKPRTATHWQNLNLIAPNLREARELFAQLYPGEVMPKEPAELAVALSRQFSNQVVLKMSERGLLAVNRDGARCRLEALSHDTANVSGAGDTVFATLSIALASGAALEEAAVLANIAASLAVAQQITHAVSAGELLEAVTKR